MTFQRNLGYGDDGRGGPGGDAATINTTNPNTGRTQATQESAPTPPAPLPIADAVVNTGESFVTGQYKFQAEVDDLIIGHAVILVDNEPVEQQQNINICKPPQIQKSLIDTDGEENDAGEIITYAPDELGNAQGTRKREIPASQLIILEKVDPPYLPGDLIYATESAVTGFVGVQLQDLNIQSRRWIPYYDWMYFRIAEVDRDVYRCDGWDPINQVTTDLEDIYVAKPWALRGVYWNNQTINGITYTVSGGSGEDDDHETRSAQGSETQDITPRWQETLIIKARYLPEGTGAFRNGIQAMWQDMNISAHAFAKRFE